jgi:lysophospholipase L1-like esterase
MIKQPSSQSPRVRIASWRSGFFFVLMAASLGIAQTYKFDFGSGPVAAGYTKVLPTSKYTKSAGFGFDSCSGAILAVNRGGADNLTADFIKSGNKLPFSFSFDAPEGNYRVSVVIGDAQGPSEVTINAESHRLMAERINTATGQFLTKTFIVNRRDPKISTGGSIGLKMRDWPNTNEPDMLNWDGRLTLEFADIYAQQNICAVEAVRIDTVLQVFLAGNSTVTDQEYSPWGSWGQMIPRFFNDKVVVVNLAESGLASTSFGNRLNKATSMMHAGDYMFVEFGHNDNSEADYNTAMKGILDAIKAKQGIPVIVSPICRRYFDATGKIDNSTGQISPYSAAARALAKKENVLLVDLTAMTKSVLDAVGEADAKKLYVSFTQAQLQAHNWTRFTGTSVDDKTHTNIFGAYEYAKCIRTGVTANIPDLAKYFLTDIPAFDPTKPDNIDTWLASWTWSPYPEVKGNTTVAIKASATQASQAGDLSVNAGAGIVSYTSPASATQIHFLLYAADGKILAQRRMIATRLQGSFAWSRISELSKGDYILEMKVRGSRSQRVPFSKV